MAVKTFNTSDVLTASDTNTYLNNGGLVWIKEGSATSGTVLNVDNCFSATYDSYRIVISDYRTTSASTGLTMRLRVAGVDSSTSYTYGYAYQALYTSAALTVGGTTTGTSFDLLMKADTIGMGATIDIHQPFLTQWTTLSSNGIFGANTAGSGMKQLSGIHAVSTAYDGFSLTSAIAFANIKVRVYGYRQA